MEKNNSLTSFGNDGGNLVKVKDTLPPDDSVVLDTGSSRVDYVGEADNQGVIQQDNTDNEVGFTDGFGVGADQDWLSYSISNIVEDGKLQYDENFDPNDLSEKDFDGVPTEYIEGLKDVTSKQEFDTRKQRLMLELEADRELAEKGGVSALAGRLMANVLDPAFIPAMLFTGGTASVAKGARMAQIAKAGIQGASFNAATSFLMEQGKETHTVDDVMLDAGIGFVMNASVRGLFHNKEEAQNAIRQMILSSAHKRGNGEFAGSVEEEVMREGTHTRAMLDAMEHEAELDGVDLNTPDNIKSIDQLVEEGSNRGEARFGGQSFAGVLQRSKNKYVKSLGDILVNSYGGYKGGGYATASAEDFLKRTHGFYVNEFAKIQNKHSARFYNANRDRLGFTDRYWSGNDVNELNRRVGLYMSGATKSTENDPNVIAMAGEVSALNTDILRKSKEYGLEGAEHIQENSEYMTRMWDKIKLRSIAHEDKEAVEDLFVKAVTDANPELDVKLAKRIGRGITRTLTTSDSFDRDIANISKSTPDTIAYFLREMKESGEADIDEELIDDLTSAFQNLVTKKKGDKNVDTTVKHFKHKTVMDVNASVTLKNGDTLRLSDLFETDIGTVFSRYSHYMSGRLALASVGLKSMKEFDKMFEKAKRLSEGTLDSNWEKEKLRLEMLRKHFNGQPMEQENNTIANQAMRSTRKYNFFAYMGKMAYSMFSEVPNIIATAGVRNSLRHFPEVFKMMNRMASGTREENMELSDMLARELDSLSGGLGSEFFVNKSIMNIDEGLMRGNAYTHATGTTGKVARAVNKVEHATEKASRLTARLSLPVDSFLKRWALVSIANNFADIALGKSIKGVTGLTKERMKIYGITQDRLDKINEQIRKHASTRKGRVTQFNIENWDMKASDDFGVLLRKIAGQVIQENDVGSSMPFMYKPLAKLFIQFRTWTLHSINKQLKTHAGLMAENQLYAINALAVTTASSTLGGLSWAAMMYSTGRGDEVTPQSMVINGVARSSTLGLLPVFFDTLTSPFMDEPVFSNSRSSGQAQDILANPTYSTIDNINHVYSMMGNMRYGEHFDQGDAKALQRLSGVGSYPFISGAISNYIEGLPE